MKRDIADLAATPPPGRPHKWFGTLDVPTERSCACGCGTVVRHRYYAPGHRP